MRRFWAILLVVFSSFSLIAPVVFFSDADSPLPACCRRNGKHACAMLASQSGPSGASAQAARCPLFPATKAMPGRTASVPGNRQAIFAGLVSNPAAHPQIEAQYRICHSRAGLERGPPTPLS